jgi:hypothetical protein
MRVFKKMEKRKRKKVKKRVKKRTIFNEKKGQIFTFFKQLFLERIFHFKKPNKFYTRKNVRTESTKFITTFFITRHEIKNVVTAKKKKSESEN